MKLNFGLWGSFRLGSLEGGMQCVPPCTLNTFWTCLLEMLRYRDTLGQWRKVSNGLSNKVSVFSFQPNKHIQLTKLNSNIGLWLISILPCNTFSKVLPKKVV